MTFPWPSTALSWPSTAFTLPCLGLPLPVHRHVHYISLTFPLPFPDLPLSLQSLSTAFTTPFLDFPRPFPGLPLPVHYLLLTLHSLFTALTLPFLGFPLPFFLIFHCPHTAFPWLPTAISLAFRCLLTVFFPPAAGAGRDGNRQPELHQGGPVGSGRSRADAGRDGHPLRDQNPAPRNGVTGLATLIARLTTSQVVVPIYWHTRDGRARSTRRCTLVGSRNECMCCCGLKI